MKKLLTAIILLLSLCVYSQDCKECIYRGNISGWTYYRYVEIDESCPYLFLRTLNSSSIDGCVTLPIELYRFEVKPNSYYNLLEWETLSENNNSHFIIYNSEDGYNWEEIGRIKGSGNSNQNISYKYEHNYKYNSNYYKLVQFDYNGDFEEFDIIYTINKNIKEYKLYNINGIEVNDNYKGLIIIKYENGDFKKEMKL